MSDLGEGESMSDPNAGAFMFEEAEHTTGLLVCKSNLVLAQKTKITVGL